MSEPTIKELLVARPRPEYVKINRNLMNYPLARDPRMRVDWKKSRNTGRWFCKLDGFTVWLPADCEDRHLPGPLDANVLFLMLGMACMTKRRTISFGSQTEILKAIGLSIDSTNMRRLKRSLAFWSSVTISFDRWLVRKKVYDEPRKFRPPIRTMTKCRPIEIEMRQSWLDASKGYFKSMPIPLPMRAAVQNLILVIETAWLHMDDDGILRTPKRRTRNLCRKIGVGQSRKDGLANTIAATKAWFKRRGEKLTEHELGFGIITFTLERVERPASKSRRKRPHKKIERKRLHEKKIVYAIDDEGHQFEGTIVNEEFVENA